MMKLTLDITKSQTLSELNVRSFGITLFKSTTMLCGTGNIMWNMPTSSLNMGNNMYNNVMVMNNMVMWDK